MADQTDPRRALGEYGERLAERYLRDRGLAVVDRNWRCARGEIDLVARDGDCLVVLRGQDPPDRALRRTRRGGRPGARRRGCGGSPRPGCRPTTSTPRRIRIDVIGILRPADGPARVRHLEGVGA